MGMDTLSFAITMKKLERYLNFGDGTFMKREKMEKPRYILVQITLDL